MTNAEFRHKLETDEKKLELINYIIDLPFDEYTERASMLLQIIDDTKDNDLRVALLAAAWHRHEEKTTRKVLKSI